MRKPFVLAAAVLVTVAPLGAGLVVEDRPTFLISTHLVMEQGVPCIPLVDVARALGGTLHVHLEQRVLVITPGDAGVLAVSPGRFEPPAGTPGYRARGRSGPAVRPRAGHGGTANPGAAVLRIGDGEVMIGEYEAIMMRPGPMMPLPLLARLLGGAARFDSARGIWLLPPGGPVHPLRFR